ncbi:MAG: hypothetical protein ACE5JI_18795 [Acidobacteriota bacterium]
MKIVAALLCAFFALAPAKGKKPELKLKAPRMVFLPPSGPYQRTSVTIRVTGRLEGDPEDPEEYYCLEELWEWGDETESSYQPDCDPYEEGGELKRHFSASRQYRYPGTYRITLRLQRDNKTVLMGRTRVRIRGN